MSDDNNLWEEEPGNMLWVAFWDRTTDDQKILLSLRDPKVDITPFWLLAPIPYTGWITDAQRAKGAQK